MDTSDLYKHVCKQMKNLESGKINEATAHAQAELCRQANNLLKYELERVKILMKLENDGQKISIKELA